MVCRQPRCCYMCLDVRGKASAHARCSHPEVTMTTRGKPSFFLTSEKSTAMKIEAQGTFVR